MNCIYHRIDDFKSGNYRKVPILNVCSYFLVIFIILVQFALWKTLGLKIMLVESVLFKHMNEQRCEHLNTTTGPAPLLHVNIFVFFPPECICSCPYECICFPPVNIFVFLLAAFQLVWATFQGHNRWVIPPSVDMSEFVDFSPLLLPRTTLIS